MFISAIQNQTASSVKGLQVKKSNYVGLSRDLKTDSFSKNNLSFKGSNTGKTAGITAGIITAGVLTCLVPIAAPLVVTLVAPIVAGGAIGAHVDKKIDESKNKKS